jgi:hypothetical protein
MKLPHAAALALMGWYLMVPPTVGPYLRLDLSAPVSRWKIVQSFDTATACEGYLQEMKEGPGALHGEYSVAPKFKMEGLEKMQDMGIPTSALTAARCIFSDNPRLKP